MVYLICTVEYAIMQIAGIEHGNCQLGVRNGHFAPNGILTDQSIYWFFCWAKSGGGSPKAKNQARRVWNDIFNVPYEMFNESVFYKWALARRYT